MQMYRRFEVEPVSAARRRVLLCEDGLQGAAAMVDSAAGARCGDVGPEYLAAE